MLEGWRCVNELNGIMVGESAMAGGSPSGAGST